MLSAEVITTLSEAWAAQTQVVFLPRPELHFYLTSFHVCILLSTVDACYSGRRYYPPCAKESRRSGSLGYSNPTGIHVVHLSVIGGNLKVLAIVAFS
jgi:hypothetical protein